MNNDFQMCLIKYINKLGLPIKARLDYLKEYDDLVVYPLPGGKIIRQFMDGTQEMALPFEVAIKLKDQETANAVLWRINEALSAMDLNIPSANGSYRFIGLDLKKPFLNEKDNQGYYVYLLDLEANLEIGGDN